MRGQPNDHSYITVFTGRKFWPLEPRVEDVNIEDIAHALSNQCRWTGHTRVFLSVAQHCCLVTAQLEREGYSKLVQLTGLLHDASEAYLVDLARPVKHAPGLGEIYREVEGKIERVIAEKFGTTYPLPPEVKAADNRLLWSEKRDLMGRLEEDKVNFLGCDSGEMTFIEDTIIPWCSDLAKEVFLDFFRTLTREGK